MKKRITSVVLVFCMLFTMIGVTGAVAADTADTDVVFTHGLPKI